MWPGSPLARHFTATSFSCHSGHAKPEAEAYRHVLDQLGVPANAAVFVGDGDSGELVAARAAGFGLTIFMRGFRAEQGVDKEEVEARARQADAIIDRIEDLFPLLRDRGGS